MDTTMLMPPHEFEMIGAKPGDGHAPTFIFRFETQQINCLYDKAGEVAEGAIDDIRNVYYAVAITRHPWYGLSLCRTQTFSLKSLSKFAKHSDFYIFWGPKTHFHFKFKMKKNHFNYRQL